MEQKENIIASGRTRVSDLRSWHRLTAICPRCGHRARMAVDFIAWERPPYVRLAEVERKLRCMQCGNRQGNTLAVRALPRN